MNTGTITGKIFSSLWGMFSQITSLWQQPITQATKGHCEVISLQTEILELQTAYVSYLPNRQKRRLNVFHGSVCNINTLCQHKAVKKHIYIFKITIYLSAQKTDPDSAAWPKILMPGSRSSMWDGLQDLYLGLKLPVESFLYKITWTWKCRATESV